MVRLVFDLEANGLLDTVSRIHCLVIQNIDTGSVNAYTYDNMSEGVRELISADLIIGHNVIGYDLKAISKLYPWATFDYTKVRDTLVLSRLYHPNIAEEDFSNTIIREAGLTGRHSLKAWGLRLGFPKDEYNGGWEQFSDEMLSYCKTDVAVTAKLWNKFEALPPWLRAIELEHQVAEICVRQEQYGWAFDEPKAIELTKELMAQRVKLEVELQQTFKPFYLPNGGIKTEAKDRKFKGTLFFEGAQHQKIKLTVFNPGSRAHIANRLKFLYGWEPTELTETGQAKVDETVLGKLSWPEAKLLSDYFLVQKRLGMLAEGEKAWLKYVRKGRMHGAVITNGAVTGRATHHSPNIAQVPSVISLYGPECRALFHVPKGKKQVGVDLSGIELRMLAHYMAKYDKGAYGKIVCEGDVHTANQLAAGLPTRDNAKTFIYAFLKFRGSKTV